MKQIIFTLALISLAGVAQAERIGHVRSGVCPFSCRTEGIPERDCKDWKAQNLCYVEDLRGAVPTTPSIPSRAKPNQWQVIGGSHNVDRGDPVSSPECQNLVGKYLARPRITILQTESTGSFLGASLRIKGEIEGVCVIEAGLFEDGRKLQIIPTLASREFKRFQFEVVARGGKNPEIRAYNVNGNSDRASVHRP